MKRIAVLLLALLLLPACGRVGPTPETTTGTTTSAIETTTQEESTTEAPFVPTSGESNGVKWRTLDLEDEVNAVARKWLEKWYTEWGLEIVEWPMGKDKTIVRKEDKYLEGKLILRENRTGKETVLLEEKYLGESDNPSKDEVHWISPFCQGIIDDRFVVVRWRGWESSGGVSVYDTKEMREIPLENEVWTGDYFRTYGNHIYLTTHEHFTLISPEGEVEYGPLSLQKAEVTSEMGEILLAVELLNEYPGAETDAVILGWSDLSPDERYFAASEHHGLLICDLEVKQPAWHIPFPASKYGFDYVVFRDAHTIYCFRADRIFDNNSNVIRVDIYDALEITLP